MSDKKNSGHYSWNQVDNIGERCSTMNEIIHEHHLNASDIPIPLIYETIETGDLESFIAFCEKKEREANVEEV